MDQLKNQKAYKLWINKLCEGYRLCGFSGRDLHKPQLEGQNFATTYLGINGQITPDKMKKAIEKGRVFVSLAPLLNLNIKQNEKQFMLGDEIKINDGEIDVEINIDLNENKKLIDEFSIKPTKIKVMNNGKYILQTDKQNIKIKPEKGFVIFELYGEHNNCEDKLLAFTSPVYIV